MRLQSIKNLSKKKRIQLAAMYNEIFLFSPWSEKYFLAFLQNRSRWSLGYIIKEKNELAGFVLGRNSKRYAESFNLSVVCVDKKFRSKGAGKLLIRKIIQTVSRRKKLQKIFLHFRDANNLKNYYSCFGFSNHKIDGTYSNGDLKNYMELKIIRKK